MSEFDKGKGLVIYDSKAEKYYGGSDWYSDIAKAKVMTSRKIISSKISYFKSHKTYIDRHDVNVDSLCLRRVVLKAKEDISLTEYMKGDD